MSARRSPELRSPSLWTVARAQWNLSVSYLQVRRTLLLTILAVALAGLFAMTDGFPALRIDGAGDGSAQEPEVSVMFIGDGIELLADGIVGLATAFGIACLYGFLSAFRVWRDTSPRRRGYYWSLPVDRFRHDLIRVAAGGVPTVGVLLAIEGTALLGMLVGGHGSSLPLVPGSLWGAFVITPVLLYLLASIAALRANRPAVFILAATGVLYLLFILSLLPGGGALAWLGKQLVSGPYSLTVAVLGPVIRMVMNGLAADPGGEIPTSFLNTDVWPIALTLWLAAALSGVLTAARVRPRNR